MYRDRIRLPSLLDKVMSAADAAALIQDGMTVSPKPAPVQSGQAAANTPQSEAK